MPVFRDSPQLSRTEKIFFAQACERLSKRCHSFIREGIINCTIKNGMSLGAHPEDQKIISSAYDQMRKDCIFENQIHKLKTENNTKKEQWLSRAEQFSVNVQPHFWKIHEPLKNATLKMIYSRYMEATKFHKKNNCCKIKKAVTQESMLLDCNLQTIILHVSLVH